MQSFDIFLLLGSTSYSISEQSHYNTVIFHQDSQKTPHSSHMTARYGVPFVSSEPLCVPNWTLSSYDKDNLIKYM